MVTLAELHAEEDRFFAPMGRCIGMWARIEVNLFKLFQVALGAPEPLCGVIFWAVPSFSMRLSYTSSLVIECLTTPSISASNQNKMEMERWWDGLKKEMIEEYAFRNRLAHQHTPENSVEVRQEPDGTQVGVITHGTVDNIFPNPYDRKQKFAPIKRQDIIKAHNKAQDLWVRLDHFTANFHLERQKRF